MLLISDDYETYTCQFVRTWRIVHEVKQRTLIASNPGSRSPPHDDILRGKAKQERSNRSMVRVYETWRENVGVYTDCLAIQWKASQKKDRKRIRSENSEDALAWQTFHSLEAAELLDQFVADQLGLTDHYIAYYWQRRHNQYDIDPTVDRVLAEVEPYHRQHGRQHTETDLILRGEHTLIVAEIKLGYKKRKITAWRQGNDLAEGIWAWRWVLVAIFAVALLLKLADVLGLL